MTLPRRDVAARLVRAIEAFEDGDPKLGLRILDDLRQELTYPARQHRHPCPFCGARFPWPGLRDAHVERVHGLYERRRAS